MSRRNKVITALLAIGVFTLWFVSAPRFGARPQFPSGTPVSIDITLAGHPLGTIRNPAHLGPVTDALRSARSVPQHECKSRGEMILRFPGGEVITANFNPGHPFLRYEIATSKGWFTLSRPRLFRSLAQAGIDTSELPK